MGCAFRTVDLLRSSVITKPILDSDDQRLCNLELQSDSWSMRSDQDSTFISTILLMDILLYVFDVAELWD